MCIRDRDHGVLGGADGSVGYDEANGGQVSVVLSVGNGYTKFSSRHADKGTEGLVAWGVDKQNAKSRTTRETGVRPLALVTS